MTTLVPGTPPTTQPTGRWAGFVPAFTWGVRLALGRRRRLLIVMLVTAGVGALAGFFSTHNDHGVRTPVGEGAFQLWDVLRAAVLPFCVPLAALTLVAGAFQREVSERTLVFHLVRPISRRTLYVARLLSASLVAIPVALLTPLTALAVAGLPLPASVAWSMVPTVGLGVLATGAMTALLSAWFRFGIIASLIYVFVIDSFMNEATGTMQRLSIVHHVLSLFHRFCDPAFSALSPRVQALTSEVVEPKFDPENVVFQVLESPPIPWMEIGPASLVLLGTTVVTLVLGAWIVSKRDYPLKD
jgi:ABC-type transport system involved in multi-copper enzyme maturation permease subunit